MQTILIVLACNIALCVISAWAGYKEGNSVKDQANTALAKVKVLTEAKESLLKQYTTNYTPETKAILDAALVKVDIEIHNALDEIAMLKSKAVSKWQALKAKL